MENYRQLIKYKVNKEDGARDHYEFYGFVEKGIKGIKVEIKEVLNEKNQKEMVMKLFAE